MAITVATGSGAGGEGLVTRESKGMDLAKLDIRAWVLAATDRPSGSKFADVPIVTQWAYHSVSNTQPI
jgi:hypothetical protein